jgi:hypothetical protein
MAQLLRKWQFWVFVFIAAALAAFYFFGQTFWNWAQHFFSGVEYSATIVFTNLFGLFFGILLIVAAYNLGAVEPVPLGGDASLHGAAKFWRIGRNLLITLIGTILGWAFAIAYTPFGDADAESLNTIMKTISIFLSGYVVSKIDRFLEGTLFEGGKPTMQWVPLGLFATAFLLSTIVVFVNRVYVNDVNRKSVLSFSIASGNSRIVFGPDQIFVNQGKFFLNDVELVNAVVKDGDFIKLNPRTREVEINGRSAGKVKSPESKGAGNNTQIGEKGIR